MSRRMDSIPNELLQRIIHLAGLGDSVDHDYADDLTWNDGAFNTMEWMLEKDNTSLTSSARLEAPGPYPRLPFQIFMMRAPRATRTRLVSLLIIV